MSLPTKSQLPCSVLNLTEKPRTSRRLSGDLHAQSPPPLSCKRFWEQPALQLHS